jgi:hypothetical protein
VLLPVSGLLRRVDLAEVIGAALLAKAAGRGHRQVAAELGVPQTTVRGWLRRFVERAELVRGHFTRLAVWLDPQAGPITSRGSPVPDAVEAIGMAAVAATRRFGLGLGPWEFVSGATGGRLLCNTSSPFPAPWWAGEAARRPSPASRGDPARAKEPPWMTAATPSRCFATRWSAKPPIPR